MKEPRISIYTNQSTEHTKNDGLKLFVEFMKLMGTSSLHFSGEIDTKLRELYLDGKKHGF